MFDILCMYHCHHSPPDAADVDRLCSGTWDTTVTYVTEEQIEFPTRKYLSVAQYRTLLDEAGNGDGKNGLTLFLETPISA
jgi:hypothetical protein